MNVIHEEADFEGDTGADGKPVKLLQCMRDVISWNKSINTKPDFGLKTYMCVYECACVIVIVCVCVRARACVGDLLLYLHVTQALQYLFCCAITDHNYNVTCEC